MNIQNKKNIALPPANQRGWVLATSFSYASEVIPDAYSGPYIGGGINYQYTIGDALLNDNLADVKTDRINARDINLRL